MKFATNGVMYSLYYCHTTNKFYSFPTNLPETKKKEWMIEKRGLNIKVYCNGKLVLDQTVSSDICNDEDWLYFWSKTVNSFSFYDASPTDSFYIGW